MHNQLLTRVTCNFVTNKSQSYFAKIQWNCCFHLARSPYLGCPADVRYVDNHLIYFAITLFFAMTFLHSHDQPIFLHQIFKCMKKLFFLALLFSLSGTAFAQQAGMVGKWAGQFTNPDGTALKFTLTITDKTYHFDIGSDGTTDSSGEYTSAGDRITIWDTAGQNVCPSDQKGVYRYAVEGDMVTFTKVTDACPGRGNEPMVLKRAN